MYNKAKEFYSAELKKIKEDNLWKGERIITTQQQANIDTTEAKNVLNMCANNYLGMANDPRIIKAGQEACDKWGYGMSSVRFICGTQQIHKDLEAKISEFLETEDTILVFHKLFEPVTHHLRQVLTLYSTLFFRL